MYNDFSTLWDPWGTDCKTMKVSLQLEIFSTSTRNTSSFSVVLFFTIYSANAFTFFLTAAASVWTPVHLIGPLLPSMQLHLMLTFFPCDILVRAKSVNMVSSKICRKDYITKNMGFLTYLVSSIIEPAFGRFISFFPLLGVDSFTIDIKYATVTDLIHLHPASFLWVYSLVCEDLRKIQIFMAPLG